MPRLRGDGHGDLYAKARVVLPTEARRRGRRGRPEPSSSSVDQPDPRATDHLTTRARLPSGEPMQLDRYTEKAQEAIAAAQRAAEGMESPVLDAEHLLHALVEPDDGVPAETLRRLGVDLPAFRGELAGDPRPSAPGSRAARCRSTRGRSASSSWPRQEARRLGDEYVSTEHLLLGVARGRRRGPRAARAPRRRPRGRPRRAPERPRRPAGHLAEPGGHLRSRSRSTAAT